MNASATDGPAVSERRPSPAEVVAGVAVAALTRQGTPPEHSATISRNARGVFQFEVTTRGYDLDDVLSMSLAAAAEIAAVHPYPDTNGGETA